jgi:hypothetical protein
MDPKEWSERLQRHLLVHATNDVPLCEHETVAPVYIINKPNDVVGYLVTWSEQFEYEWMPCALPFDDCGFAILRVQKLEKQMNVEHIHLYKSVNGKLEEIKLSEGNDE